MWVNCVVCCSCVWCDSVTWRCLHGRSWVNNLQVQRYNTWTTDWHPHRGLQSMLSGEDVGWVWVERPTGHRRLWANVSAVCRWPSEVCLASVGRWRWQGALVVKVLDWRVQTSYTVSDIHSLACDVTRHQTTDAVGLTRQWTQTCSTAGPHGTIARRRVTDWDIYHQSQEDRTEVSDQWSQRGPSRAASVHRFTSITTRPDWTHRHWLSRQRTCSRLWQSSYSAARCSAETSSTDHRRISTQRQAAIPSVLQRTNWTTAAWVGRQEARSVWCSLSIDELTNS